MKNAELIEILKNEKININLEIVKVEMPETPELWSFKEFVKYSGLGRSFITDDIRKNVLKRDKHYVMKGSHYLFIRDEVIPYVKNRFKLQGDVNV